MQIHVSRFGVDIHTSLLKTRLFRAVCVINAIPGDRGQCLSHLSTCCTPDQRPQDHRPSPSHLGMLM